MDGRSSMDGIRLGYDDAFSVYGAKALHLVVSTSEQVKLVYDIFFQIVSMN